MELRGYVGFKGERGLSAYEVAVKNGFIGSEQDWLATLGTSSHFERNKTLHIVEEEGEQEINLPQEFSEYSFVDVFIEGECLNSTEYEIDTQNRKIVLTYPLNVVGTKVEVVVINMTTNELPIVTTINESADNTTTPGTKAVWDLINPIAIKNNELGGQVAALTLDAQKIFNKDNFAIVTGSIQNIESGQEAQIDINYPANFSKDNAFIISKMVSANNNLYETNNSEESETGFPEIKMIALTDSFIRVWMKNTSSTSTKNGYFKIGLMKFN